MSLRRLNLAVRSVICFGVFCLLILGLGLAALREASTLHQVSGHFQNHIVPAMRALGDLDTASSDIAYADAVLRNRMETEETRTGALNDLQRLWTKMTKGVDALAALQLTAQEQQALTQVQQSMQSFAGKQKRYERLIEKNDLEGAVRYNDTDLDQSSDDMQALISAFVASNDQRAKEFSTVAEDAFNETLTLVVSFSVLAVVVCVLIAWLYTRSVLSPVRQSLQIAERIANDDLSEAITVQGSDELARLVGALARMQDNLCQALGKINDSSTQLAATSEEMHVITEDASRGMQRQANEVEMAATAVTEMSAAIEEVARNSAGALELAQLSSKAADNGCARVDETLSAIHQMAEGVHTTAGSVKELTSVVAEINTVLADIRAVAEQTNLLALNAAIEAARAGEAGRGFAVVADEVRSLARRTQVATQNIEQMTAGIQSRSDAALAAMEHTSAQAETTRRLSAAAGTALAEINQAIGQINENSLLIATAAEEQAQVAQEVDRSLISIRDLAAQSNEGAQQTSIASSELSCLAVDLSHLVKRFKL